MGAQASDRRLTGRNASRRARAIVVAVGVAALLPFLGQTRDVGAREVRHAQIAREMAASGDYAVPTLLGREYDDKPPALYAAIAPLYRLAGGPSLGLARLPSVVAAVLGAVALHDVALVLDGPAVALPAAVATLSAFEYQHMARTALPDMLQTAAILAACLGIVLGMRARRAASRLLLFAFAGAMAGVAVVAKGPLGFAVPILFAGFAWLLGPRELRQPAVSDCVAAALALGAAIGCWAVPAYLHDRGAYLSRVVLQRDLTWKPDDVIRPCYWYLPVLPKSLLPITFLVPWLARGTRRRGWTPALALALALLVLLSIAPKKRPHYLLPLVPFAALAAAESIDAAKSSRLRRSAGVLFAVALAAGPLYLAAAAVGRWKPENAKLAAANEVIAAVPPGSRILCFEDLAEEIAFTSSNVDVQLFDKLPALAEAARADAGKAFVVVPGYARAQVIGSAGNTLGLGEQVRVHPPGQPRDWSVYAVGR